jgi:dTDP-glucose 4,6-dehydratase
MNAAQQKILCDDCERVVAGGHASRLEALRNGVLLVTGGTGFMGTWVSAMVAHLNDRHRFGIRLRLLSGHASRFRQRAPHLADRKDVELIERDIVNVVDLPDDVTWIIHAAADPDSRVHMSDPLGTVRVILRGTDALLQAAARLGNIRKILHVSSGLIYGSQPLDLPLVREGFAGGLDCSLPSQSYAEAKRAAETICAAYRTQTRLPIATVRPFAFLGPCQLLDRPWAANSFIRDSLLGGPIRIHGDGESVRSYMYPADMALWLLAMLAEAPPGSTYNLGSPVGVTLNDLAAKIVACFPHPVRIINRMLGANAPGATRLVPDVSLAQRAFGLPSQTDLETAIRRAVKWYGAGAV